MKDTFSIRLFKSVRYKKETYKIVVCYYGGGHDSEVINGGDAMEVHPTSQAKSNHVGKSCRHENSVVGTKPGREAAVQGVRGYGETKKSGKNNEAEGDVDLAAGMKEEKNTEGEAALLQEEFLLRTYPRSVEQLAAVAAQRRSLQIWRLLARVCEVKHDYDRATAFLTEALRTQPHDVASLSILARIAEKQHGPEAALPWHRRLLAVKPNIRASQLFVARWHYARGEYREAIPYFERLLFKERGDRVCELYWLLANVHCYGIHGLEKRLALVSHWSELTAEERPLVHELFVLAGRQSLDEAEFASAERYLLQAHHIMPSQEVTRLLATVAEKKEDQGREARECPLALPLDPQATEHDAWIHSWMMSLHEESRQRRQALWRAVAKKGGLGLVALLLIMGGVFGYHRAQQWFQALSFQEYGIASTVGQWWASLSQGQRPSLSAAGASQAESENGSRMVGKSAPPAVQEKRQVLLEETESVSSAVQSVVQEERPRGEVVTATELGIQVSGRGAKDPRRSPASIQQEIEKYLAELQDTYEKAWATDPSLMGSLVLDLTIESAGWISRVRFQSTKIASQAFQKAVSGLASKWRFPAASGEVTVYYPLIFLPPGMDAASIIAWEKNTATLKTKPDTPREERTPQGTGKLAQQARSVEKRGIAEQKLAAIHPLGVYKVIAFTPLRSQPRGDAQVLTYLRPRMQVTIVGMTGDYLHVRSVERGSRDGYVHWADVTFVQN